MTRTAALPEIHDWREEVFAIHYLVTNSQAEAAVRAGYNAKDAANIGWRLMQRPSVKLAIERHRAALIQRVSITADRVAASWAKLAFSNIRNFLDLSDPDNPRLTFDRATDDDLFAVKEITTVTRTEKNLADPEGDPITVTTMKLKMTDRAKSLESIAKMLKMLDEPPKDPGADDEVTQIIRAIQQQGSPIPYVSSIIEAEVVDDPD